VQQGVLKMSVGSLADLAELECDRCFWLDHHLPVPLEFPFPRVLGDIDRATKDAVVGDLRRHRRLPDWHPSVGRVRSVVPAARLHPRVFRFLDPRTGVLLRGSPDMVFELEDGSYHVVDYKVSRAPLDASTTPRYRVQLNAYALLAEKVGIRPVSGLSVVYLEAGAVLSAKSGGYAALQLHARRRSVPLDPARWVLPLLRRASNVLRRPDPPDPHPDCETCVDLEQWARELLRARRSRTSAR
jgi:hypothetical protein